MDTSPQANFSQTLVRPPSAAFAQALSAGGLRPHWRQALIQHQAYAAALAAAGARVHQLPAHPAYPDAPFVEDTAVLFSPELALITRPGAPSRQGEEQAVAAWLAQGMECVHLAPPATLDGGDVLQVGQRMYVGLSQRTNAAGVEQLAAVASRLGREVVAVAMEAGLHLKTGINLLPDGRLLAWPGWLSRPEFATEELLPCPAEEPAGANVLAINGQLLVPAGCPRTAAMLAAQGYSLVLVDIGEYAKADGGLTCLSLRW